MQILLINHYAGSPIHGMEFRPYYLAKEWCRLGHRVRIVASSYSHLHTKNPEFSGPVHAEEINGIEYLWLKTPPYKGNRLGRTLNMASFTLQLRRRRKRILQDMEPDLVIASTPHPFIVGAAHRMAAETGARFTVEVRDLWPESLIELVGLPRWHPFALLTRMAERHAYRVADNVISLLPTADRHMVPSGLKAEKFGHVPNGVALGDLNHPEPIPEAMGVRLAIFRSTHRFLVGYAGAHGTPNALEHAIAAADLLASEGIGFVFLGEGERKEALMAEAQKLGLSNVLFLEALSKSSVPSFLQEMDALYIGWHNRPLYQYGISPNKLFEYMHARKPIVHSVSASNDLVATAQCGVSCPAGDPEGIAAAILRLRDSTPKEREAMGQRGNEHVTRYFGYAHLAKRFLEQTAEPLAKTRYILLTQYYHPELGASQNRLRSVARGLWAEGGHVEVLTAMPNYPKAEVFDGYRGRGYCFERIDGIPVHRAWIRPPSGGIVDRLNGYFSFVLSAIFHAKRLGPADVVVIESPPLFLSIAGYWIAKKRNARVVFNVADLWPQSAQELKIVTSPTLIAMATQLEEWSYKKAFLVTGQTKGILTNITGRFPRIPTQWMPNGLDTDVFSAINRDDAWKVPLGLSEKKVFFYAGTLGHAQGLDIIVRAAKALRDRDDIAFVIMGDGPVRQELQTLNHETNAGVTFLPPDSREVALARVASAYGYVVPLKDIDLFRGAVPSKIFDGLGLGVPILLGVLGEAHDLFISQVTCGLAYQPDDHESLCAAVVRLADDSAERDRIGAQGRNYAWAEFDRTQTAQRLLNALERVESTQLALGQGRPFGD